MYVQVVIIKSLTVEQFEMASKNSILNP